MEALANGMVPLATRHGALAETLAQQTAGNNELPALPALGTVPDEYLDAAAKQLVEACKVPVDGPKRLAQADAALERFDVDALARQWLNKLELGKTPTAAGESSQVTVSCGGEPSL